MKTHTLPMPTKAPGGPSGHMRFRFRASLRAPMANGKIRIPIDITPIAERVSNPNPTDHSPRACQPTRVPITPLTREEATGRLQLSCGGMI